MMKTFKEFIGAYFKDIQPLSNFDIIQICKRLKISNFKSCFMRDEIRNLCGKDECFILNTDHSRSQGTHWVGVNIAGSSDASGAGSTIYYFDSFGFEPTAEIKHFCKEPRFYNSFEFQKPNEVICGHPSLYFLYRMRNCKIDVYTVLDELYKESN